MQILLQVQNLYCVLHYSYLVEKNSQIILKICKKDVQLDCKLNVDIDISSETDYVISAEMEYCNAGSLRQLLLKRFSIFDLSCWVFQMTRGLLYLHKERKFVHRDIKPENIFVKIVPRDEQLVKNEEYQLLQQFISKYSHQFDRHSDSTHSTSSSSSSETNNIQLLCVGDFGLSKQLMTFTEVTYSTVGSFLYMSPEIFIRNGYSFETDVWSLGICILEALVVLDCNYDLSLAKNQLSSLRSRIVKSEEENQRYLVEFLQSLATKNYPSKLLSLLFETLQYNPKLRPSIEQICQFLLSEDVFLSNSTFVSNTEISSSTGPTSTGQQEFQETHSAYSQTHSDTTTLHTPLSPHIPNFNEDNILADACEVEEATQFWTRHFQLTSDIKWSTFVGAYQLSCSKLALVQQKGLRKLLCVEDANYVSVYQFIDRVNKFGFPFPYLLLEKMEKYLVTNTTSTTAVTLQQKLSAKEEEQAIRNYLEMIVTYDKWYRDITSQVNIDIETECVPLQLITPQKQQAQHETNLLFLEDTTDEEEENEDWNVVVDMEMEQELSSSIEVTTSTLSRDQQVENAISYVLEHNSSNDTDPLQLFILGPACSGKTFLLRMLLFHLARKAQQHLGDFIPVFVSIAALSQVVTENSSHLDTNQFLWKCIVNSCGDGSFQMNPQFEMALYQKAQEKKIILLLDGLDECITSNSLVQVGKQLQELCLQHYSLVVSSRIRLPKLEHCMSEAKLVPLTSELMVEIAKRRGIQEKHFFDTILGDKYVTLLQSPLILSMMIESYKQSHQLPANRNELYRLSLDSMLKNSIKRMISSNQLTVTNAKEKKDELYGYLLPLAHWMHTKRKVYISEMDISQFEKQVFINHPCYSNYFASFLKEWVVKGNLGCIVYVPPISSHATHQYKFFHLTFQEYLTSVVWKQQLKDTMGNSKRHSLNHKKLLFLEQCIKDLFFKETFCFLASGMQQDNSHLWNTILEYWISKFMVNQKSSSLSLTSDYMIYAMAKESQYNLTHVKKWMDSIRTKKSIEKICQGLFHASQIIQQQSLQLLDMYQFHQDEVLEWCFKKWKTSISVNQNVTPVNNSSPSWYSLVIAIRKLLLQQPLDVQEKYFKEVGMILQQRVAFFAKKYAQTNRQLAMHPQNQTTDVITMHCLQFLQHLSKHVTDSKLTKSVLMFIWNSAFIEQNGCFSLEMKTEAALLCLSSSSYKNILCEELTADHVIYACINSIYLIGNNEWSDVKQDYKMTVMKAKRNQVLQLVLSLCKQHHLARLQHLCWEECSMEQSNYSYAGQVMGHICLLLQMPLSVLVTTWRPFLSHENRSIAMKCLDALFCIAQESCKKEDEDSWCLLVDILTDSFVICPWMVRAKVSHCLHIIAHHFPQSIALELLQHCLEWLQWANHPRFDKYKADAVELLGICLSILTKQISGENSLFVTSKQVLQVLMEDSKFDVRKNALHALFSCLQKEELNHLLPFFLNRLSNDSNHTVKYHMIQHLSQLCDRGKQTQLIQYCLQFVNGASQVKDLELIHVSIKALGLIGDFGNEQIIGELYKLLEQSSSAHVNIRIAASDSLVLLLNYPSIVCKSLLQIYLSKLIQLFVSDEKNGYYFVKQVEWLEMKKGGKKYSWQSFTGILGDNDILFKCIFNLCQVDGSHLTKEQVQFLQQKNCVQAELLLLSCY